MIDTQQDVLDTEGEVGGGASGRREPDTVKLGRLGFRSSVCARPSASWIRTSTSVRVASRPSMTTWRPARLADDRAALDEGVIGEDGSAPPQRAVPGKRGDPERRSPRAGTFHSTAKVSGPVWRSSRYPGRSSWAPPGGAEGPQSATTAGAGALTL